MLLRKKRETLLSLSKILYNNGFNEIYLLAAAFPIHAIQRYNAQQAVHQTNPLI